jgi:hypothetical protein
MTERYPMLPPAADSVRAFSAQPTPDHRPDKAPASDSARPVRGLSRRMALTGLAVFPVVGIPTSAAEPDPAFALIRAKREADVLHSWAIDAEAAAEEWQGSSSDAARKAAERSYAACEAVNEIDWKLATTPPTTLAGVVAVLRLANLIEDAGSEWPLTDTVGPDGWHYHLRATMASAIEAIIAKAVQS